MLSISLKSLHILLIVLHIYVNYFQIHYILVITNKKNSSNFKSISNPPFHIISYFDFFSFGQTYLRFD